MATIQVKLERNLLTTPPSWRVCFLPRNIADCKEEETENTLELAQEEAYGAVLSPADASPTAAQG
jgi:hypothetical protein